MKLLTRLEDLSNILYQDPCAIDSENMGREIVKTLSDNLKNLYNFIEKLDASGLLDANNANLFSLLDARDGFDLYQVGDAINLLNGVKLHALDAESADW